MSRSPKFEKTGEVQFRIAKSSIRLLYDVIGNLDAMKKELVKSIGFGGILCFPPLRQMNRRFAVWLMSRVDPCSQTIVINESRRIKYSKEDVSRVFGLPCNGRSVFQNGMPRKEIVSKVTTGYLGIQAKGNRSIKAAQEVIERDYGRPMSQDEENAFKAAFVIYVASTLLAPGAKYDCPSVDYWNALADPSDIDKYDWADYVIRRLFDAVLKVKSDLKKGNVKAPSITGCSLFLQVLYLDSIDTGVLNNLEHNTFPRVMLFGPEVMRSMILADTLSDYDDSPDDSSECEFGKSKLRSPTEVCYSWASESRGDASWDSLSNEHVWHAHLALLPTWEAATSWARALSAPAEAAGPLYFALADSHNHTSRFCSTAAIWLIYVFKSIIEPYLRGFSYNTGSLPVDMSSLDGGSQCQCGGQVATEAQNPRRTVSNVLFGCSSSTRQQLHNTCLRISCPHCQASYGRRVNFSNAEDDISSSLLFDGSLAKFIRESSIFLYTHCMATRAMAQYYLVLRGLKLSGTIDLNYEALPPIDGHDLTPRKVMRQSVIVKTPWDLGLRPVLSAVDEAHALKVLRKLDDCVGYAEPCIAHYIPKCIEVLVGGIKMQISARSEMEMDLFDAVIRRFKEIDDRLYDQKLYQRWRHFLEADFMGSILAGSFDINDPSIRGQLIGRQVSYDVVNCKMLFFPALLEHRWVCYAWSLEDNNITVFDPWMSSVSGTDFELLHRQVASTLKRAMHEACCKLFDGCIYGWEMASVVMSRAYFLKESCVNRTGFICAQFCFSFDGSAKGIEQYVENSERACATLLVEVLKLSCNHGYIPEDLRQEVMDVTL